MSRRLEQSGYLATSAENARQALDMMHFGRFDLVLLDLYMPQMDGFEVLRSIRANEAWRELPVLMISADGNAETVNRSYELGADDYLVKPHHASDLQVRLAAAVALKQGKDAAAG